MKDFESYTRSYHSLAFERIQEGYRRKTILKIIKEVNPSSLLEVGCGAFPLFSELPNEITCCVVEPAKEFYLNARGHSTGRASTKVFQACLEDLNPAADIGLYDLVVVSCLLHEVKDPIRLLHAAKACCVPGGIIHINVPNGNSIHRLLAVAMGLTASQYEPSETQRTMQQRAFVYSQRSLAIQVEAVGLQVIQQGAIFVKPFTHSQMAELVRSGFMTSKLLDGLDELAKTVPEIASEIWINAKNPEIAETS